MKSAENKNLAENIRKSFSKVAGYVIWILIIILSLSLVRNLGNSGRIKENIEAEEAKVRKMQEENARLSKEISETRSQGFIEKQIRDKLGLVQSGESIVVLPDEDTLRKLAPQISKDLDALPDPNWKRWLKLFM